MVNRAGADLRGCFYEIEMQVNIADYITSHAGYLAGIATSIMWTSTTLLFTAAGRRLGPTAVNALRIFVAVILLAITHRLLAGYWIPQAVGRQVAFLAASGLVGLAIGDQALFTAFVYAGPRLSTLLMTTSPLCAALLGYAFLGEALSVRSLVGIALTVSGIAWVIAERQAPSLARPAALPPGANAAPAAAEPPANRRLGIILALVGAICQAGGMLLSKAGMGHGWLPRDEHLAPQTATLLRMFFAGLSMIPILLLHSRRQRRRRAAGIASPRVGTARTGYVLACCGAVTGPFLGVWLSLVATDLAPIGIAQTLCSLTPVFILPILAITGQERISLRAAAGALVAVGGSALLF